MLANPWGVGWYCADASCVPHCSLTSMLPLRFQPVPSWADLGRGDPSRFCAHKATRPDCCPARFSTLNPKPWNPKPKPWFQGNEVALQMRHSPHPHLYAGPSDRSNMHAQEFVRDPATVHQTVHQTVVRGARSTRSTLRPVPCRPAAPRSGAAARCVAE